MKKLITAMIVGSAFSLSALVVHAEEKKDETKKEETKKEDKKADKKK